MRLLLNAFVLGVFCLGSTLCVAQDQSPKQKVKPVQSAKQKPAQKPAQQPAQKPAQKPTQKG